MRFCLSVEFVYELLRNVSSNKPPKSDAEYI